MARSCPRPSIWCGDMHMGSHASGDSILTLKQAAVQLAIVTAGVLAYDRALEASD
jgi:hypothetical protein